MNNPLVVALQYLEIAPTRRTRKRDVLLVSDENLDDFLIRLLLGRVEVVGKDGRDEYQPFRRDARRDGIAVLTRVIARMAAGEDTDPKLRKLLADVLTSGGIQLVPQHHRRGRVSSSHKNRVIVDFIRKEIHEHPQRKLEATYTFAMERYGLSRRRIMQIMEQVEWDMG